MSALRHDDYNQYVPRQIRQAKPKTKSHRGVVVETSLKLGVNLLLSSVAIVSLLQILPYHSLQKSKLEEVSIEVNKTQERVNELRENFRRNFAPEKSKRVIQEQNNMMSPKQIKVVISPTTEPEKEIAINKNKP